MKTFNLKLGCTVFLSTILFLSLFGCDKDEVTTEREQVTDSEILSRNGKPDKIDICHYSVDDGQWILINVKESSWADHVQHGDVRLDDQDGDGFVPDNECGFGAVGDCDDGDAAVNPGVTEVCDNSIDDNCDGQIDENCAQAAQIGDLRDGGVVFWVDPADNTHGLVCALSDSPLSEWGCFGQDLSNVPNVTIFPPAGSGAEIGDGMTNTNGILTDCPAAPAALAARSLGTEWFLPSAKELNEMYENKVALEAVSGFDAFVNNSYWSSTEYFNDFAWAQNFLNGNPPSFIKDFTYNVRAVRAF